MGNCDKCGEVVPQDNDATILAVYTGELSYGALLTVSSRHLLPTGNCEGSPSRAQYLPGMDKDTRGYKYVDSMESKVRDAFIVMMIDIHNGRWKHG